MCRYIYLRCIYTNICFTYYIYIYICMYVYILYIYIYIYIYVYIYIYIFPPFLLSSLAPYSSDNLSTFWCIQVYIYIYKRVNFGSKLNL